MKTIAEINERAERLFGIPLLRTHRGRGGGVEFTTLIDVLREDIEELLAHTSGRSSFSTRLSS